MTKLTENLYAARDIDDPALSEHYQRHIDRMTVESLHSKSAIAAELACRDARIAELEKEYDALNHEYGLVVSQKYAGGV